MYVVSGVDAFGTVQNGCSMDSAPSVAEKPARNAGRFTLAAVIRPTGRISSEHMVEQMSAACSSLAAGPSVVVGVRGQGMDEMTRGRSQICPIGDVVARNIADIGMPQIDGTCEIAARSRDAPRWACLRSSVQQDFTSRASDPRADHFRIVRSNRKDGRSSGQSPERRIMIRVSSVSSSWPAPVRSAIKCCGLNERRRTLNTGRPVRTTALSA